MDQKATQVLLTRAVQRGGEAEGFPIREYVGSMASELARMAEHDGDSLLAQILDVAAEIAGRPQSSSP